MKILIFVCGEGLGHTSRCLALGQEFLGSGHEVHFGAYGYSKDMIEKMGYRTHEIPSEVKLVGKAGYLDILGCIIATIKNFQITGVSRVRKLTKDLGPDVVVSDSYYLGILAAIKLKIPIYLITNQSNMEEFFQKKGIMIRLSGKLAKKFYTRIFEEVDKMIIPDYPLPYTVCQENLSFTPKVRDKLFYSGPLVRTKYDDVEGVLLKKPHVVAMIGGFGYREPIFRKVLEAAKLNLDINYTLISGPSIDPDTFTNLPENVRFLPFIKDPFPYFKSSDAIIAPGGHSTMMEALSFGIPILSIPDERHSEQENNALVIEKEGYGRKLSYSNQHEDIVECIREVLDGRFKEKTEMLRRIAKELDGPKAVRQLIEKDVRQRVLEKDVLWRSKHKN